MDSCPSYFLESDGSVITFSGDAVPIGYGHISYYASRLEINCHSNNPSNCFCNNTLSTFDSVAPICCNSIKYSETFNIKTTSIPDHFAQIYKLSHYTVIKILKI